MSSECICSNILSMGHSCILNGISMCWRREQNGCCVCGHEWETVGAASSDILSTHYRHTHMHTHNGGKRESESMWGMCVCIGVLLSSPPCSRQLGSIMGITKSERSSTSNGEWQE